jgi:hypothetical protein
VASGAELLEVPQAEHLCRSCFQSHSRASPLSRLYPTFMVYNIYDRKCWHNLIF